MQSPMAACGAYAIWLRIVALRLRDLVLEGTADHGAEVGVRDAEVPELEDRVHPAAEAGGDDLADVARLVQRCVRDQARPVGARAPVGLEHALHVDDVAAEDHGREQREHCGALRCVDDFIIGGPCL